MNFKNVIVIFWGALLSTQAMAVSICKNCEVTGIQADPRRGGTYIFMSGDWSESSSSCTNTRGNKAFWIESGSQVETTVISLALVSLSTGKMFGYVHGSGVCSPQSYEHINFAYLKK